MTSERSGAPGHPSWPDEPGDGPAGEAADEAGGESPPGPRRPLWRDLLVVTAAAVAAAVVVKALFLQAFYIPSESMQPGLVRNDRILVQKVSYQLGSGPERGDVVVFEDPGDWLPDDEAAGPTGRTERLMAKVGLHPSGGRLVKRVIGVAGDVIHCCDDEGRIVVNGEPLDEEGYASAGSAGCYGPMHGCDWTAGPVPDGSIFVMGDNRSRSADSSYHLCDRVAAGEGRCTWGEEFVQVDLVVGKVFVLLWPWRHFTWLERPDAFAAVPPPAEGD